MKKYYAIVLMMIMLIWGPAGVMAAEKGMTGHQGMDMSGKGSMGDGKNQKQFHHTAVNKEVRAEFQIMSLESMNIKNPEKNTHHVMIKLFHEPGNHQYKQAVGKVKIIGPDKAEQVAPLENFNGIFAANFTFQKKGKYGVICLVKVGNEKHVFKFWYPFG